MSDQARLEPDNFLRMPEVSRRVGRCPREIYRMIKRGEFPRQHRQSHKVAVWYEREIEEWQIDRMAADLLA